MVSGVLLFRQKNLEAGSFCIQKINNIGNGQLPIDKNFAAIFIGANAKFRKWSPESYAKVADYLSSHYGFDIVLLGGSDDIEDAKIFDTAVRERYEKCSW